MAKPKTRIGFYSGSFDPVTLGHMDVIVRACALVDTLVIGIGVHDKKAPLFSGAERIEMLKAETRKVAKEAGTRIEVVTFDGLVVAAAAAAAATTIFRGLRDGTDFDYEMQMAGMNEAMQPHVRTVFLPSSPQVRMIAASLVRQIAMMGGDVSRFVTPTVAERLETKVQGGRAG